MEGRGRWGREGGRGWREGGGDGGKGGRRADIGWSTEEEELFSPIGRERGLKVTQLFPEEGKGNPCFITSTL